MLRIIIAWGLWHTKKGNFKLARLYFDKVLSLEQAHVLSLIQIAYLLIRQNQVLQAKRYLQQATSIDSSHPDIYKIYSYLYLHLFWSRGGKQLDSHYLHNAREVLATAQKLSPQNVNINLELIELDIYLRHYDKAEQTITKLVRQVPLLKTNARLHYLKGLVRLYKLKTISKQELKTVVTNLSKALQFNPDNSFIRHILETTVMDYSAKLGGNKILRSQLAHYHFKKAKEKQANYRRDLMPAHLSRVLYLYPQHKGVLGMQLELLEDAKDYEAILSIHKQLYELNPKNVKLRYRLEKIFQGRKQNIAYREKLFNPFRSTEKSTFQRTPPRIFVFDLLPVSISLQYPDAPRQVARCLNLALQTPGPLASTTEKQRDRAIDYIQAQQTKNPQKANYSNLHTIFYHSDHLGKLRHILNKGKEKIHYLLSGHYHSSLHGIDKVSLSLRESNTGHIIHRFQVKAAAQETMFHLAMKARKVILKHIPIEGEIIKINRDHEKNEENIFINLGLYDGLQLKNHLLLTSLSTTKAALQVEELGAYVSRVSLLKDFATKTLEAGAPVRLLP